MVEKIKVVGYARFSSSNQREESITAQKRFISMYADNNKMEIVDWYADAAKTGKTVDRPEFQRLLHDVQNNPDFRAVIVHKFDRFSRNTEDTLHYKELFRDYGVEVISVSENIDDTPAGKMMLTMMSSVNQYYIDNLSLEVMKGMKESALLCRWTGGIAPLGYDVVDQKLVINETEAKAVRLIFEMAADGYGYGQIIDKLNLLGYKTKLGKPFGKNSIYDLLRNERFKGNYLFNRRSAATSLNRRNNHKYKPDSEVIRIEGGCPAIVSKSLWERANAVRRATRCSHTNAQHPYLLTGLLYCDCGGKFHGNIRRHRQKGLEYTTYRCSERVNKRDCDVKEIRCSILDAWVIEQFIKFFFNDENIPVITKGLNEHLKHNAVQNEQYIEVEDNLKTLEKSRDNLIEAIIQTGSNEAIAAKINEYERQIAGAKAFLEAYDSQTVSQITEDAVRERIGQLRDYMMNPENLARTKYVLSRYIDRIDISNESIKATFRVAFCIGADDSILSEFKYAVHISRKALMRQYSDTDSASLSTRIIENLMFSPCATNVSQTVYGGVAV